MLNRHGIQYDPDRVWKFVQLALASIASEALLLIRVFFHGLAPEANMNAPWPRNYCPNRCVSISMALARSRALPPRIASISARYSYNRASFLAAAGADL